GDTRRGGHGDGAGDAGHDGDGDAGAGAGDHLLAAAAEHERVAALEPDHELAFSGAVHEQPVDLLLRQGPAVGDLGGVDQLDVGGELVEQGAGRQPVGHDHVGLGQELAAAHGDQAGVARAAADEGDADGFGTIAAVVDGAVAQRARHGVADAGRPARVAAGGDGDADLVDPAGRGRPGGRGVPVVGAYAPDALGLGLGGDGGVDRPVVGARLDEPGAVAVTHFIGPGVPGDAAGGYEVVQRGGDGRRDDAHLRSRLEQRGYPPLGDAPAAHDEDPAA